MKYVISLLVSIFIIGCCSKPIIKEKVTNVTIPVPAILDSAKGTYIDIDKILPYYEAVKMRDTSKTDTLWKVKFIPSDTIFHVDIRPDSIPIYDTFYVELPQDTIIVREPTFWQKLSNISIGAGLGVVLMLIVYIIIAIKK